MCVRVCVCVCYFAAHPRVQQLNPSAVSVRAQADPSAAALSSALWPVFPPSFPPVLALIGQAGQPIRGPNARLPGKSDPTFACHRICFVFSRNVRALLMLVHLMVAEKSKSTSASTSFSIKPTHVLSLPSRLLRASLSNL